MSAYCIIGYIVTYGVAIGAIGAYLVAPWALFFRLKDTEDLMKRDYKYFNEVRNSDHEYNKVSFKSLNNRVDRLNEKVEDWMTNKKKEQK